LSISISGVKSVIVFNLICSNDHPFEGWFASAADFERQQQTTLLSCPTCGSNQINKTLHAPHVNTGGARQTSQGEPRAPGGAEQYANIADHVSQLIENLIANTQDVGDAFPEEARRIHYKEAPERRIRGNASRDDVKELREEGIEVVALPIPRYRLDKSH
jgi:hypothetical protein